MHRSQSGIFLISFFFITFGVWAQQSSVSPYSKVGAGDIQNQNYFRAIGFAGANIALPEPINLNVTNPASYNSLELTTFEVGVKFTLLDQTQADPAVSVRNNISGFQYVSFGLPLTPWWGSAIGVQPYTFKGYDINTSRFGPDSIGISDQFEGDGGLNRMYWGHAFRIARGLSAGFNSSLIFGSLEENQAVIWEDASNNSVIKENATIRGLKFDYGLRYIMPVKTEFEMAFGLTYANQTSLNAKVEKEAYTTNNNGVPMDTLDAVKGYSSNLVLPNEFGFGWSYGKKTGNSVRNYAWALSADFHYYQGSNFESYNGLQNQANGYRLEAGGFVTPSLAAKAKEGGARRKGYFSYIEYRLGGFYEETPIVVDGQQLSNYGITFGFGVPIRQRGLAPGEEKHSYINLGATLGTRGTTSNGLIQENYINIHVGLTLSDRWFIKYKYR